MAMPATTRWTAEMARALPDDGNRYEVIDGELFVTPSPTLRHQEAGKRPSEWTEIKSLVLAVEILSPSTARADRHGVFP